MGLDLMKPATREVLAGNTLVQVTSHLSRGLAPSNQFSSTRPSDCSKTQNLSSLCSSNPSMAYSTSVSSVHFSSVTQLCLTLCDPMDCSTRGFPLLHQLLELAQIHVHQVSYAIQPSHPLSSPSLLPPIPRDCNFKSVTLVTLCAL